MRNAFAKELYALARDDDRVVMMSGDIGNRLFDSFQKDFGARFFNCGVAEANMMTVAAGMALGGLRPVVYTIAPFVTYRCYEQIKIDVCYQNAPVVIVGVGGGLGYAGLGPTHHSLEDCAVMRVLPGMAVVCAADAEEVRGALRAAMRLSNPTYIRIGKKGEPNIHTNLHDRPSDFQIGRSISLRTGTDVALLGCGAVLPSVLEAADVLLRDGVSCTVQSFHTVKPLDEDALSNAFQSHRLVVSIEEHSLIGGLGSAIAEWKIDRFVGGKLLRLGTPDVFFHEAGETHHARERLGLSPHAIVATVKKAMPPA